MAATTPTDIGGYDYTFVNTPPDRLVCRICDYVSRDPRMRDHVKQCPKYPLPCPNNCEVESVLREDMETHKKECPLEVIQCEYHNMGCEERMMRKNKRKHEEEHMDELSWPLKERFEIKLLNQISNHEHHMHIVIYDHTVSRLNADRIYDDNIWISTRLPPLVSISKMNASSFKLTYCSNVAIQVQLLRISESNTKIICTPN
ncbi:TNF receptor-associated factor family protein DDB_G0290965-like isoform X3 [Dysidea avara]|uniref:TNF receptor-associated factor family protein DDB_G0290965-like isoform X3 n=1 Tax=Dysidea avara TaxID=196820 RepID=UPI00333095B9